MSIVQFSFESSSIRTLGDAISPLFVAADVAAILGYGSTKDATRILDDDEKQTVSIDTNGGKQSMTAVTESGLYAMILKSRRPEAKRFRKWVTSEVLPAIRKTGRYEAPKPEYITIEHRWAIQKAVGRKARGQSVHYQTVYRALKDRFKVEKYTHILEADFDAAIAFIESLPAMELPPESETAPKQISAAQQKEPRKFIVDERYIEDQLTFVYYMRYLFKEDLDLFYNFLVKVGSPRAGRFWEAVHGMHLFVVERNLQKLGYDVKDLDCYKAWLRTNLSA